MLSKFWQKLAMFIWTQIDFAFKSWVFLNLLSVFFFSYGCNSKNSFTWSGICGEQISFTFLIENLSRIANFLVKLVLSCLQICRVSFLSKVITHMCQTTRWYFSDTMLVEFKMNLLFNQAGLKCRYFWTARSGRIFRNIQFFWWHAASAF